MAALTHNPSRRALLGAAAVLPFVSGVGVGAATRPLHQPSPSATAGPPPRPGEDWERALRAFEAAETMLREYERRTAGAPWAEQAAVEEQYGECLDALYGALRRLLRVPAPDLSALAAKIGLIVDHEAGTLNGGEACLAALRRDALRLCLGHTQNA